MSVYVVDASVAAKWFIEEPDAEAALRLVTEQHELHAPDCFVLEMDSVLCKWLRRGVIADADADAMRTALGRVPIETHPFDPLRDSAYSLARGTGRGVYDCLYLALAASLVAQMVTADRRLYDAVASGPFGGYIVWIGDVQ